VKVLGLMGSPRKKGNADLLLDRALDGAKSVGAETEKVLVAKFKISPCIACGGCDSTGECVVHDGMGEIYPKLEEAQGIIIATPVFFMGLPGRIKGLVDRCQPFWVRKYRLSKSFPRKRPGLLIAVGGTNLTHTFDAIRLEVKSFFHCLDVKYSGEVLVPGISEHGEIAVKTKALEEAYQAGQRLGRSVMEESKVKS
jgi:multimeric flavodoxin WrbA